MVIRLPAVIFANFFTQPVIVSWLL